MNALNIAEIFYATGEIKFRYSRYLSTNGESWVRHGLFEAYHPNGVLATEGHYVDGKEHGLWIDYHDNGKTAAKGHYKFGEETGAWEYWDDGGKLINNSQSDQ